MDLVRAQLGRVWRREMVSVAMCATLAAAGGCDGRTEGRRGAPPEQKVATVAPGEGGSHVSLDSALTLFRAALEPTEVLEEADTSREGLIARLVDALARSDTAALRSMVLSRREFAYLFYPSSHYTQVPTKQEAGLAWFLHLQTSQKGATRLLNRFGGRQLDLVDTRCDAPLRMGSNTLWSDCVQRIARGADTTSLRLIGGILERDGRFKIFSYSNDL